MSAQHRILIVLDSATGALLGASATDEAGSPRPLDLAALGALAPAINTGSLARIADLETALAAALAAPPSAPGSDLLSGLDTAFETLVPAELQAAFEPAWVTVRNLIQAGKTARAAAFVRGLDVPEGLVAAVAQIADMIDGGA